AALPTVGRDRRLIVIDGQPVAGQPGDGPGAEIHVLPIVAVAAVGGIPGRVDDAARGKIGVVVVVAVGHPAGAVADGPVQGEQGNVVVAGGGAVRMGVAVVDPGDPGGERQLPSV